MIELCCIIWPVSKNKPFPTGKADAVKCFVKSCLEKYFKTRRKKFVMKLFSVNR